MHMRLTGKSSWSVRVHLSAQNDLSLHDSNCKPIVDLKKRMNGLGIKKYCRRHSDSFCVCGRHQNRLYITSAIATTDLVTERWVIQRVQFVGDVFANEVPKHLIEKSICLQEVGEPLSRPTQKLAVLLSHNGHLKKKWHPSFDLKQGKCAGKCTYCTHYSCPTAAREDG